ncbi:condensation domain-containing protein [Actinospica robiniae]|uniref:condensation domain-containing protein n=1 Tax=Actinospica robiniae TaxID=304901 RepID=UPI00055627E5|nr:condensation domain-containing protein [Actinospica robiniae]
MPPLQTGPAASGTTAALAFDAGAEEQTAPLTWGQLSMWMPMQWFGEQANQFNLKAAAQLPEPVAPDRAADALRTLIEAHQATRTHFVPGPDGPRQMVAARGCMTVHTVPQAPDAQTATDALTARLAATAFDHATQWPVRLGWVVDGRGMVTGIVLVVSHLAFDGWALERLTEELLDLLRNTGPAERPAERRWQPLDQAGFERSAEGLRKNALTLRHWRERLAVVPASMFDLPGTQAGAQPVEKYRLDTAALVPAVRVLAGRTRTTASTVLLCVSALILAAYTGQDGYRFKLIVGNRHDRNSRELLTITTQDGLLALPVEDVDLISAIKAAYRPMLAAYQRGQCDPLALDALIAEAAHARGVSFDLSAYFNDKRTVNTWTAWPGPAPTRAEFDRLRADSRFAHVASMPKSDMKYCVGVADAGGDRARLTLLADTAFLPRPVGEAVLRGIESLVCDAAGSQDVGVREIAQRIGLEPPARGVDWTRSPAGWIRPAAIADLIRTAAAGAPAAVFPGAVGSGVPGGSELTAYIAADGTAHTPERLHRRVMGLLPGVPGAAAPSWYVVCDRPPTDAAGRATEGAWQAQPGLAEGSGRAAGDHPRP